ncbi:hypothetical protein Krac_1647 [Ktedonobacter racemifer DSM 44963]|uniref:Uncharacterized protein n=1 Tax=Ktedonobacter racemifer DSM 44963 TaxID=485913 RepID=D6U2N0_KTERA|nr:hypothetical protein Krac_1647 [Ktedonobacter racemifer DSM 44963]
MQRAFQFPEVSEVCSLVHHAPTASPHLYSLPRFPLYAAFRRSKAGRDSREYYRDSVTLLLAQGRAIPHSHVFDVLAHRRCPFVSFTWLIASHSPKRGFRTPTELMRIWVTSQVAFNDERSIRRWKLGLAIQLHHSARDTWGLVQSFKRK